MVCRFVPTWGSFQSFSLSGHASATTPGAMKQQKLSTWPVVCGGIAGQAHQLTGPSSVGGTAAGAGGAAVQAGRQQPRRRQQHTHTQLALSYQRCHVHH